jgi:hypothetical protein
MIFLGFSPPFVETSEGRHYPVRKSVEETDLGSTGTAKRVSRTENAYKALFLRFAFEYFGYTTSSMSAVPLM